MPKLPAVTPRRFVRALERLGFRLHRASRGSHLVYVHPDGRRVVVPMHTGRDLPRGTLVAMLKDIDVTVEELRELL